MSAPETIPEAADGQSQLTAELGALADQFECHAASRSIDEEVEAAGRAMRAAKAEIERLHEVLIRSRRTVDQARDHFLAGTEEDGWTLCALRLALDSIDEGLDESRSE